MRFGVLCGPLLQEMGTANSAHELTDRFAAGPLGAFTFAGKFFFLFAAGAIFGRAMGDSG